MVSELRNSRPGRAEKVTLHKMRNEQINTQTQISLLDVASIWPCFGGKAKQGHRLPELPAGYDAR